MPHLATYDIEPEGKEGQLNLFEFTMVRAALQCTHAMCMCACA